MASTEHGSAMTPERQYVRRKHEPNLQSSMRLGDWSLDKYEENEGFVVYHWACGFWSHSFHAENKDNRCYNCKETTNGVYMPDEIQALYRLINFDLMTHTLWNSSL